jgi:penicillin amidase
MDMTAWRWGQAHVAMFTHPVLGKIPVVADLVDRAVADDGAEDTVHAGGYRFASATPYADVHGPGLRAIYDLADLDRSRFMIAPGESADPVSPWYDDLLGPWQQGAWLTLPAEASGQTLRLEPTR